jgi:hypothetical protein
MQDFPLTDSARAPTSFAETDISERESMV